MQPRGHRSSQAQQKPAADASDLERLLPQLSAEAPPAMAAQSYLRSPVPYQLELPGRLPDSLEKPADRQLLFVEHVLPVKCHKIKYFDDPIFTQRLLPAPGVKDQDVSTYVGGRTGDHFAMWQERVNREGRSPELLAPATFDRPVNEHRPSVPAAAPEFSLDFSVVKIPPGRFLTGSELDAAVHSFLDELETA
jgi:hypothetical protein